VGSDPPSFSDGYAFGFHGIEKDLPVSLHLTRRSWPYFRSFRIDGRRRFRSPYKWLTSERCSALTEPNATHGPVLVFSLHLPDDEPPARTRVNGS
jgi:hypothetical protein